MTTETNNQQGRTMIYYVIDIYYVGPEDLGDVDTIGIYKTPAYGWDGRPVVDGRATTIGDWTYYGRGGYATIDEARARIDELYPERRKTDEVAGEDIVELYKLGK